MRQFSNRYMLLYALGLAAVVAVVLTLVSTGLKSRQDANVLNEKKQMLLTTIGIDSKKSDVDKLYQQYFKEEMNLSDDPDNPLTLYVFEKDGERGYVIPTKGRGLWGGIFANIALADDLNTIVGITFSHVSETPGLGAEIASEAFCNQFIGKQILDELDNVVSVAVVKHADMNDVHQVDAISGGTMTSNGVSEMLATQLALYQDFIKEMRKEANNE